MPKAARESQQAHTHCKLPLPASRAEGRRGSLTPCCAVRRAQLQAVRDFMRDTVPLGVAPRAPQEDAEPEEELDVTEEEETDEEEEDVEEVEEEDDVDADGLMHQFAPRLTPSSPVV